MNREAASRHRQALRALRQERDAIEDELLEYRDLLRGSLVAHTILSGGYRRRHPAFYLSRVKDGRRRMIYIKKPELESARRRVETYRRFQSGLHRLRALSREIFEALEALRESEDALGPS